MHCRAQQAPSYLSYKFTNPQSPTGFQGKSYAQHIINSSQCGKTQSGSKTVKRNDLSDDIGAGECRQRLKNGYKDLGLFKGKYGHSSGRDEELGTKH